MNAAAFAGALLDPRAACPDGVRAWNGSDPARRLAVYRNNVMASLIDAMAQTFPVVQELVGEEFFRAMAGPFVRRHPPRTRVLAQYGGDFPAFIEGFGPAGSVPYLADVARLEMARVEAFHAADAEPLDGSAACRALECGERIGELRLALLPSVRLVQSRHAIVSIWAAHQGHGDLADVDPDAPEEALVLRPQLDVVVLRSDPGMASFVQCIQRGADLAECAATAASEVPGFDLAAALQVLAAQGALASIALPSMP